MWLLLLLACPKPAAPPLELEAAPPPPVAPVPAGSVVSGEYVDDTLRFRLRVPDGWRVRVGARDEDQRVVVEDPRTGVRVAVSSWPGDDPHPRPRDGCAWDFEAEGHFRAVRVAGAVHVATCTPTDPDRSRVLGYYFVRSGRSWALESTLPPGRLLDGKTLADDAIGGLRFTAAP